MTLVQSSIFDFKPLPRAPPSARWILGWMDEGHAKVCSTDAAAMAHSVGQIPTSGTWLRCLPIDRNAPYNQWCREWDSRIWWHNSGVRYEVLVKHDGTVQGFLDPWPHSVRFDKESHKYNEVQKLAVLGIRIGEGVLTFETSDGEWSAEIKPDAEVRQWDRHPYRPTYDLEHFAMECHRHRIPEGMMAWRAHYVWATAGLRPFYKTSDHPAVFKEDRFGRVDWAIVPNDEYSQICGCAARMGLALELDHEVPALDNRAMWPVEQTCASCLRRGSANEDEDAPCWKRKGTGGCCPRSWMWDRRTPAKGLKEKKGRKCECMEDDGDDCEREHPKNARGRREADGRREAEDVRGDGVRDMPLRPRLDNRGRAGPERRSHRHALRRRAGEGHRRLLPRPRPEDAIRVQDGPRMAGEGHGGPCDARGVLQGGRGLLPGPRERHRGHEDDRGGDGVQVRGRLPEGDKEGGR